MTKAVVKSFAKEFKLSAVITKEDDEFVSWCPELDIASQGATVEEALDMLKEAVELYLEGETDIKVSDRQAFVTVFQVNKNV